MLNANDSATILNRVSSELIKRELPTILNEMSPESKIEFVNSVRTLAEVSGAVEKEILDMTLGV